MDVSVVWMLLSPLCQCDLLDGLVLVLLLLLLLWVLRLLLVLLVLVWMLVFVARLFR